MGFDYCWSYILIVNVIILILRIDTPGIGFMVRVRLIQHQQQQGMFQRDEAMHSKYGTSNYTSEYMSPVSCCSTITSYAVHLTLP